MNNDLRIHKLSATPNPQIVSYAAMIQDYSEGNVYDQMWANYSEYHGFEDPKNPGSYIGEKEAGERVIRNAFKFGHFGVIEHPHIVVNVIGYPHATMQQLRTHRHLSFDVQSGRYTGERIIKLAEIAERVNLSLTEIKQVEDVFYIRSPGIYKDRHGHSIEWTKSDRHHARIDLLSQAKKYANSVNNGMPYEMARDLYVPYSVRQNFVASGNLRTWLHVLEMRGTRDAEIECQIFSDMMLQILTEYAPEIVSYWAEKRYGKNKLAP